MGRDIQNDQDGVVVRVKAGESRDLGTPTSDFIIADRSDQAGHQHVVLDNADNEIYNSYNLNQPPAEPPRGYYNG